VFSQEPVKKSILISHIKENNVGLDVHTTALSETVENKYRFEDQQSLNHYDQEFV
jgi:hypothetical protein